MEFQDVVRRRRMVRNFEDRPIPDEILERIIDNALHAPSAGFSQGWAFLVLQGKDKERFHEVTFPDRENFRFDGTFKAPLLIVCLSHKDAYLDRYAEGDKGWTDRDEARWPAPYWDIDTGFAALLMLLTVVDAGLGAVFFGITPDKIPPFREAFGVPEAYNPIGAIAIGYRAPDELSPSLKRGRRSAQDVVHYGRWQSK
jgi:nitroreductase